MCLNRDAEFLRCDRVPFDMTVVLYTSITLMSKDVGLRTLLIAEERRQCLTLTCEKIVITVSDRYTIRVASMIATLFAPRLHPLLFEP